MAGVEPKVGRPYLKKDTVAFGDVSGIIGVTGAEKGSMSLSFSEPAILTIVSNLVGVPVTEINEEVKDAVGELTNMICGDARRRLQDLGVTLQAGTPTVVSGKGHSISHFHDGPFIGVTFEIDSGSFVVEVAFGEHRSLEQAAARSARA
ncbi:chemotaxis protein CheX [Dissulfurirhabdus thermomarina]|uniref:Chemotaxis protein CheX n=2 Tax=Dissulfurirhabdus thermomarina TaxID=1765737 RepID=A0A6N9TNX1_DISTH|nr:chemotaxis protein CheX [Dissulfurirhabdus thermomarina]NDY42130.1 chemotaxis protein CheX [Dissulfurirhabdus thermomarina]NMX23141.1 chemotaxis protein CheX [Dissulfurirhabdus thermomarina]